MIPIAFFTGVILFMNIIDPPLARFVAWSIVNFMLLFFSFVFGSVIWVAINVFFSGVFLSLNEWLASVFFTFLTFSVLSVWYILFKKSE